MMIAGNSTIIFSVVFYSAQVHNKFYLVHQFVNLDSQDYIRRKCLFISLQATFTLFFQITQQVKTNSSASGRNRLDGSSVITYKISKNGERTLSLAPGMEYPIKKSKSTCVKSEVKLCSVCNIKPKKYNCSKTNRFLCSLECYKTNISEMR